MHIPENLKITKEKSQKLEKFIHLIKEVNKRINLVSKKNTEKIIKNLIYESLLFAEVLKGHRIVDIGSGAGFPGIPLAIVKQKWNFILIERNKKKAEFLRKVKRELGLNNVKIFDNDLKEFKEKGNFEFVSRGAGYREILKILRENKLKGTFYPILEEKEKEFEFKAFKNEITGKIIKIGIIKL